MKTMKEVMTQVSWCMRESADPLSCFEIYQWIEMRYEHIKKYWNDADMYKTEITEQEVMDALEEWMKVGKMRSFVKEGGDPLNPDDWLYR